ncbi:CBS domain-containing protein, partial [Klenkia terrae]
VQVRELMSAPAVTVGPATPATYAAEVLASRGFAALPVVDTGDRLLGVVAEVDLVRDRIRPDPRLHARRDVRDRDHRPAALVAGIMTAPATAVDVADDVADAARLLLERSHRSLPVLQHGRVVGVLSRRDLLGMLLRRDEEVRLDLLGVIEQYTGEPGRFEVGVSDGCAALVRRAGAPSPDPAQEASALTTLARTVPGVVDVRVRDAPVGAPHHEPAGTAGGPR